MRLLALALGLTLFALASTLGSPSGVSADHDMTCHPPEGTRFLTTALWGVGTTGIGGVAHISFDSTGAGTVSAVARDASSTYLALGDSIPATATCADVDRDGVAGLTSLQFEMRNVRTGAVVLVRITPLAGDVDSLRPQQIVVVVGATTYTGWASFYRGF